MRKLYRSRTDKMVAGVCGGLGQYLGIDSTWVRLFFVLMFFFNTLGLWVYLVLWVVTPGVPVGEEITQPREPWQQNPDSVKIIGGALIIFGLIAFFSNLQIHWLRWISFNNIWPVALIVVGGLMLWRIFHKEK
jgi:phage shock protein C